MFNRTHLENIIFARLQKLASQEFREEFGVDMHEVEYFVCDACADTLNRLDPALEKCRGHVLRTALGAKLVLEPGLIIA